MEIRNYIQILGRRKWVVFIVTAVTVLVVGVASLLMKPVYSASAMVRIAQIQDESVGYFDLNYSERLMNTYVHILETRPFLQEVIQRLALDASVEDLEKSTSVEILPNSELLEITAKSANPAEAMAIANTLGDLLVEQRARLYSGQGRSEREILQDQLETVAEEMASDRASLQTLLDKGYDSEQPGAAQDLTQRIQSQEQTYSMLLNEYEQARLAEAARANSVSIVEPAVLPDKPVDPKAALNIVLGAIVGIAGGIGLALLLENLDQSIYSADDLQRKARLAFLGSVPNLRVPRKLRNTPLLLRRNGQSAASEAFRVVRTNILSSGSEDPPRTLLVTSAERGAGKSTVLVNLAVALAQSGRQVVVVDSNLRLPCLDKVFDVPDDFGLSNVIFDRRHLDSALRETRIPGVKLLTSGPLPPNPAELLGLSRMRELIAELTHGGNVVLLDSPSLLEYTDAVVLAPMVDATVLVTVRGKSTDRKIQRALQQLDNVGVKPCGFVFNRAEIGESP
jgi:succinoglycan biosynthesis transport protein ExoP